MNESTPEPIVYSRLKKLVEPILPKLRARDRDRLQQLLPLFEHGKAALSAVLWMAFKGKPIHLAQNALRKLRQNINQAAGDSTLTFTVDTDLKKPPEARFCWFETEESPVIELAN